MNTKLQETFQSYVRHIGGEGARMYLEDDGIIRIIPKLSCLDDTHRTTLNSMNELKDVTAQNKDAIINAIFAL